MTADGGPATEVLGIEHATIGPNGLVMFDAAEGGEGDLRFAAGIVLASMSGSLSLLDKLKVPNAENMGDCEIVRHAYGLMLQEINNPALGTQALTAALMKTSHFAKMPASSSPRPHRQCAPRLPKPGP